MEAGLKRQRRKRTSDTDPLRIDWVSAPCPEGRIGLTLCPGKKQRHGVFAHWDRDLGKDLGAVRDSDATALVSLIEQAEIKALGIPSLGDDAEGLGLECFQRSRLNGRSTVQPGQRPSPMGIQAAT